MSPRRIGCEGHTILVSVILLYQLRQDERCGLVFSHKLGSTKQSTKLSSIEAIVMCRGNW